MAGNLRIDLDEYNLQLEELSVLDTVGQIVDKLNRNFRELQLNGGGPQGKRGKIGPVGCRGKSGPPGRDGINAADEWSTKDALPGCTDELEHYQYHENEQSPYLNKLIVNKWAHKSLLLTNLSITEDELVQLRDIDEEDLSYEKICNTFSDYKLKIYNAEKNNIGNGKHIHLLNSLAAQMNPEYLCESGWTISNDKTSEINEEVLRIIGRKNHHIPSHSHKIEFTTDLTEFRKNDSSQRLGLDSGSSYENLTSYSGKIELQHQSKNNNFRLPDRTGWVGIWEDTNEPDETWELVDKSELVIMSLLYNSGMGNIAQTYTDNDIKITLHDQSYVRFKRLNNWVLVDYKLGIKSSIPGDTFRLKNFQVKIDLGTLPCRTIGWHPSTIMVNENIEDLDAEAFFGFFKIDASKIINNSNPDTFVISHKFADNYSPVDYDYHISNYWITGQVWATFTGVDTVCDIIVIDPPDQCVTDFEITQLN